MNVILALANIVIKELYRRKDFYVLFVLTGLLTALMLFANIFNDEKIVGALKEICLLLIWISGLFIAVGTAARQIPAEREQRTIFPLLAKPVTRWHVVLGKFLGCWFASGLALVVFYVFLGIVAGTREHAWRVPVYFEGFWMQWMFLAVVISLVLWGSIIFAAPSSNATICVVIVVGILLIGRYLNRVAMSEGGLAGTFIYGVYFVIPHLEWFDLRELLTFHKTAGWQYCALASLYAAAYTALFLFLTWLSFRRKPLST